MSNLFHPLYIVFNNMVLGRTDNPTLYVGAFGLGSLTLGICVISICSSFCYGANTLIAQAYGAENIRLCRVYLHRQFYLNCWIFAAVATPLLFVK